MIRYGDIIQLMATTKYLKDNVHKFGCLWFCFREEFRSPYLWNGDLLSGLISLVEFPLGEHEAIWVPQQDLKFVVIASINEHPWRQKGFTIETRT